jgi:hypothetical protein
MNTLSYKYFSYAFYEMVWGLFTCLVIREEAVLTHDHVIIGKIFKFVCLIISSRNSLTDIFLSFSYTSMGMEFFDASEIILILGFATNQRETIKNNSVIKYIKIKQENSDLNPSTMCTAKSQKNLVRLGTYVFFEFLPLLLPWNIKKFIFFVRFTKHIYGSIQNFTVISNMSLFLF